MPLKSVIDNIETVEENFRPLYVKDGNRYFLDIDDETIREHRAVLPLRNAYDRTKAELQRAKEEREAVAAKLRSVPEDFDPELWKRLKEGGDPAKREAQMVEMRRQYEAERDEWKDKYEEASSRVQRVIVERSLEEALTAAGITTPTFVKAARALLIGQVKLDGDKPVVETDMGLFPLPDYVKRWAAGEGKDFVQPPTGGGARGNDRGSSIGGKTVSAKDLEAMTPREKAQFFAKNPGVVVTD
jgi:hypothetical protein